MKNIFALNTVVAAFLIFLGSAPAQAIVPVEGSFQAKKCGFDNSMNELQWSIQQICIGQLKGFEFVGPSDAVEFRLNTGETKLLRVTSTQNLFVAMMNGGTKSILRLVDDEGTVTAMTVVRDAQGDVVSLHGNFQGYDYHVPQLRPVFVIQEQQGVQDADFSAIDPNAAANKDAAFGI